jgi:hypothetical protein
MKGRTSVKWGLAAGIALAAAAGVGLLWPRLRPEPPPAIPTESELQALAERRDALQARLGRMILDSEQSLATAPVGHVMIGIPASFTRSLLEEVVSGLFHGMTLTLRDIDVHKQGEVTTEVLFRRRTLGRYVLDLHLREATGVLEPGRPEVAFGDDLVTLSLPVRLAEGQGRSDIRFRWKSEGLLSNVVCGDTDVTKTVSGRVVPQDHRLAGGFRIVAEEGAVTLVPEFPKDLRVRLHVDPAEQAWRAVQEVVEAQRAGCEAVLKRIDIEGILGGLVSRGFDVTIPREVVAPVRVPAGVRGSLDLPGVRVALEVKATGFKVSPDRLWYGADVGVEVVRE